MPLFLRKEENKMAEKFCIHCGEKIPQEAVFCPFCGGKQESVVSEVKKINKKAEDDFFGEEHKKGSIKKIDLSFIDEEEPEQTAEDKGTSEESEEDEKDNGDEKDKDEQIKSVTEESTSVFANADIDEKSMEEIEKAFSLFEDQSENYQEKQGEDTAEQNHEEEEKETGDDSMKEDSANDSSKVESQKPNISARDRLLNKMNGGKEDSGEKQNKDDDTEEREERGKKKVPLKKKKEKQQKNSRPPRSPRTPRQGNNVKKEEETEEGVLDASGMDEDESDAGSVSGFSYEEKGVMKDEVAAQEKRQKEKEKQIEDGDSREGRKKKGRTKQARKNMDKIIASRKVEDIEHEEVKQEDLEEDKDYDGYYESVLPIDHDKMRDNSAYIKVGITATLFFGMAVGLFYLIISFFTM